MRFARSVTEPRSKGETERLTLLGSVQSTSKALTATVD